MKKPQEKRLIQMEVTKQWIINEGGRRVNWKPFVIAMYSSLVFVFVAGGVYLINGKQDSILSNILMWLGIGSILVSMSWLYAWQYKKGKKLWEEVKDKPQPIKL